MQPLIDASLPPVIPSTVPLEKDDVEVEVSPAGPVEVPDQRVVHVAKETQLSAAAEGLRLTAQKLQSEGKYKAAIVQLERAIKIAPQSALLYFDLAKVNYQLGAIQKAEVFAKKALSLAPSKTLSADIKRLLARLP